MELEQVEADESCRLIRVCHAQKSLNKMCGVWILFMSVEDARIEASTELFPTLIPQTAPGISVEQMVLWSIQQNTLSLDASFAEWESAYTALCQYTSQDNTFTTRWSGCRIQVWVKVLAHASHLAKTGIHSQQLFQKAQLDWQALCFQVSSSSCRLLPADLRGKCEHSCNTDLVQESKGSNAL